MSEQALERLENLITNPYAWLLFAFIMSLSYILKFLRRFYPESVRQKMEKEEACTFEHQQKPQMIFVRKVVTFSFLPIIFISLIVSHYFFPMIKGLFVYLLLVGMIPIAIWAMYVEYKISKDENSNDVIVGYKYLKFPNIILTVAFLCFMILGTLYLIGLIF